MRILMQNRSNAFSQRGGDTVVMERISQVLRNRGIESDFDGTGIVDYTKYDLVHLFNFALPDLTEQFARRCLDAKKKYVVTTLYEDWPLFYNQMLGFYEVVAHYVNSGQDRSKWPQLKSLTKSIEPSKHLNNSFTVSHASALLVSGKSEELAIRRDFPNAGKFRTIHFGCDIEGKSSDPEPFIQETGLQDFVLCVGRIETRKNQLMLLKAMEESDLTLVLGTGGFTYQPEYEAVCRKFKRRGKTHFIGKVGPEMLGSMFSAARVHALPSWYELPGIVSLEAASLGCQVVGSDFGTLRDYLGSHAFYALPNDEQSILNAINAAYYAPKNDSLEAVAKAYTWESAATEVFSVYKEVIDS